VRSGNESTKVVAASLAVALMAAAAPAEPSSLDELAQRFAESDFVFARGQSDVPFVPLAWMNVSSYGPSRFAEPSGDSSNVSFEQTTLSEATLLPVLLDQRDALLIGQWTTWSWLRVDSGKSTDVGSFSLPLGWARQASRDWQLAAFVAPVAYLDAGQWYWDYMGGVFGRWLAADRFVWLFGLYAEIAPHEDFYVPYIGVSWMIDRHWTLSAVLPWPAVLYSPTPDWYLRLGVAPSQASWFGDVNTHEGSIQQPRVNFTSWNLGLSLERRLWKGVWIGAEAGVAGFRGFTFAGSSWKGPNSDLGKTGYVLLKVDFRPQGIGGPH